MLHLDNIYKKSEDNWVSRFILDEVVIMPLCKSEEDMQYIYSISNETGVRIFQLLDGKQSVKEIQEVLKKEFQGKYDEIEAGVLTFIEDLLSVKLIEKASKTKALKEGARGKRDEGRLLSKKKPYKTPEIAKIKMEPEQAVLSCCTFYQYAKQCGGGYSGPYNWCDRGTTCPAGTTCVNTNSAAGWSALSS
jgi:hypothetical protein